MLDKTHTKLKVPQKENNTVMQHISVYSNQMGAINFKICVL
jgi:hypothetical protein